MSNSLLAVTVDCTDARAVARFWAAVTGRQIAEEDSTPEHVVLLPRDGAASEPQLVFNAVPEPKTVKNRVHLDRTAGTFSDEAARLVGLGARKLADHQEDRSRWTTFADIEGNEFDLIAG
jgi:hypothetical protein